jgi:hypothetical protein
MCKCPFNIKFKNFLYILARILFFVNNVCKILIYSFVKRLFPTFICLSKFAKNKHRLPLFAFFDRFFSFQVKSAKISRNALLSRTSQRFLSFNDSNFENSLTKEKLYSIIVIYNAITARICALIIW